MAQMTLHRQHSYVAPALDPDNIPQRKLAINQADTKESQDAFIAARRQGGYMWIVCATERAGSEMPGTQAKGENGSRLIHHDDISYM